MSSPESGLSDINSPDASAVQDGADTTGDVSKVDDLFDDEDDDEVNVAPRRRKAEATTNDSDDDDLNGLANDDAPDENDLFGGGSDEEMEDVAKPRTLDDEDLNSDDDEDRGGNGTQRYEDVEIETHKEVEMGLHPLPLAPDEESYLLKIPQFVSIAPSQFQAENFHFDAPPDSSITPYNYATTAVRWRHSPDDPSKLQSNSRIIRWSDGSLSLQIATSKDLYDLPSTSLFPKKGKSYNAEEDSFLYIAEPLATSGVVRFVSHASQALSVIPSRNDVVDDNIKHLLASRYKAAQRKEHALDSSRTVELSYKMEDPEKARREAEKLEKEMEKLHKKRQQAQEKDDMDGLGRSRTSRNHFNRGRMNPETLEDDEPAPRKKSNYTNRNSRGRGDADDRTSGRYNKEDEYDENDSFVSSDPDSDEEPEFESSKKRKKGGESSKKSKRREESEEDEEEEEEAEFTDKEDDDVLPAKSAPSLPEPAEISDADGDADDDEDMPAVATKRRKIAAVIDSDEDE